MRWNFFTVTLQYHSNSKYRTQKNSGHVFFFITWLQKVVGNPEIYHFFKIEQFIYHKLSIYILVLACAVVPYCYENKLVWQGQASPLKTRIVFFFQMAVWLSAELWWRLRRERCSLQWVKTRWSVLIKASDVSFQEVLYVFKRPILQVLGRSGLCHYHWLQNYITIYIYIFFSALKVRGLSWFDASLVRL